MDSTDRGDVVCQRARRDLDDFEPKLTFSDLVATATAATAGASEDDKGGLLALAAGRDDLVSF